MDYHPLLVTRYSSLHRFAWIVAAAAWFLIGVGSLVTTTGSGLSIPDWPLAYGRAVPPHWEGGIAFEYTHRVIAGIVFIMMTILFIWTWRSVPVRQVRYWALGTWVFWSFRPCWVASQSFTNCPCPYPWPMRVWPRRPWRRWSAWP
jgi:heme A synthase